MLYFTNRACCRLYLMKSHASDSALRIDLGQLFDVERAFGGIGQRPDFNEAIV